MYYGLSVLNGCAVAVMILVNGVLTASTGVYLGAVIIHVVGLAAIAGILTVLHDWGGWKKRLPWYFYSAGFIGVATTLFNVIAYESISISAILGLFLLGQAVSSLAVDHFGVFGMVKRSVVPGKFAGLALAAAGAAVILGSGASAAGGGLGGASLVGALMSLGSGITNVAARVINTRLAAATSPWKGSLVNFITGLLLSSLIFGLVTVSGGSGRAFRFDAAPLWAYTGGLLGLLSVILYNLVGSRISALYVTLLMFAGQVFTGVALDSVLEGAFSWGKAAGGVLVAAGLGVNLLLDKRRGIGNA